MPNCSEGNGEVEFDLLVVENNQNQYNYKHNVKLDARLGPTLTNSRTKNRTKIINITKMFATVIRFHRFRQRKKY